MTLVEILRNLATSIIGSAVADEAKPYTDKAKQAIKDVVMPREPQQAITPGARMDDRGYPTMSEMLPAETTPYNQRGIEPANPRTLNAMMRDLAESYEAPVAGGTPYEPVPADRVMTAEEEARQAAYNPSQPIDYSDMDARLQQSFRENEVDRAWAAENMQSVHDRVRQVGDATGTATTAPYQPSGDESAMFEPYRDGMVVDGEVRIGKTAQALMNDVPPEAGKDPVGALALATVKEIQNEAWKGNQDPNTPPPPQETPSFFDQIGEGIQNFFGNEKRMLTLALAFNSLRFQPDQQLAAGIQKRLEQIETRGKATRTAEVLRARGMGNIADYIESSGDVKGGMKMAMEQGQWVAGTPEMLEAQFPELKGAFPKGATGTYRYNKNTQKLEGVGQKDQYMGTIPAGYRYNPENQSMEPIPGTEAYDDWMIAKDRKQEIQSGKETMTDTITDAANTIRDTMSGSFLPTTGTAGSVLKYIGETGAAEVRRQVKVLTSQAQVETLNSMRRQSKTGGALGSVTERELKMLSDKAGALDPTADAATFLAAVDDYQRTLYRIVHGYEAGDQIFEQEKAAYNQRVQAAQKPPITPQQARAELRSRRGQ